MLEDLAKVSPLKYVILRYFNVAGSGENIQLGQRGIGTHLIKVVCETALNLRKELRIFGTDYDTKDGTCIRDYIHVEDLASAHVEALRYLNDGGKNIVLNCGYQHGYSVKEVISAFEKLTQKKLPVIESPRREGDVPFLVADNSLISKTLSWKYKYNDLPTILSSAWAWEQKVNEN